MHIVAISDTHGSHTEYTIPECDVLIHAGDATSMGELSEMAPFLTWLGSQPAKHKIYVAGNHDFLCERLPKLVKDLCDRNNIHYLEDSGVTIDGVKFWGSPVTPFFFNWAFNRRRGLEIRKHWDRIPLDTDVLITHGPPKDILDNTIKGESVGCEELSVKVKEVKPKVHIFGHIHYSYGEAHIDDTSYYNVACLDEGYQATNSITSIHL